MKHRKLRIAWSVALGLVAALLVALWVRSYSTLDVLVLPASVESNLFSNYGVIQMRVGTDVASKRIWWTHNTQPSLEIHEHQQLLGYDIRGGRIVAQIHYAIATTLFGVFASVPWLTNRFSLRTLLVATTLIAVGLGLIVWLTR